MRRFALVILALASAFPWAAGSAHAADPDDAPAPACHESARPQRGDTDTCPARCLQASRQADTAPAARLPDHAPADRPYYARFVSEYAPRHTARTAVRPTAPEPPPDTGDAGYAFEVRRRI